MEKSYFLLSERGLDQKKSLQYSISIQWQQATKCTFKSS